MQPEVSPAPIPVALAPVDGGLYAFGLFEVNGEPQSASPLPLLIDTGSVYTTRAIAAPDSQRIAVERLTLYDVPQPTFESVPRALFDEVSVLETPLSSVGIGVNTLSVGGVLAGDLLQRFSLDLDYTPAAPSISLLAGDPACSCSVARGGAVTLPFTLAGGTANGGHLYFGDRVSTYPATRVTLSACLEPVGDPIGRGIPCMVPADFQLPDGGAALPSDGGVLPACPAGTGGQTTRHALAYDPHEPPGTDVRLLVATGFPGLLVSAHAWDRIHGAGSAQQLLDTGPWVDLHLTSAPQVQGAGGASTGALRAVAVSLGQDCQGAAASDPGCRSALALVGYEGLLGPCGELARSRRLRWRTMYAGSAQETSAYAPSCSPPPWPSPPPNTCLVRLPGDACGSPDRCDDRDQPAAPYIELDGPFPVYLVDDSASILTEVNLDVRPALPDMEGIIGTELLARLRARIDYPNGRVIARCAPGQSGCRAYPRYVCPDQVSDCGLRGSEADQVCIPPSSIPAACQ